MIVTYVEVNGEPQPCEDVIEWAKWFETADRQVARTEDPTGKWVVSTVFMGVDHSFAQRGEPIVYETTVWKKTGPVDVRRYGTRAEAFAGHEAIVEGLRNV